MEDFIKETNSYVRGGGSGAPPTLRKTKKLVPQKSSGALRHIKIIN